MNLKRLVYLLCISVSLCVLGCGDSGPALFQVSGKVEFPDGSVAKFGSIEFRSDSEKPVIARGAINKDGSFSAKTGGRNGLVAGTHSVVVVQVLGRSRPGAAIVHHHGLDVAKKYSNHQTSDLEVHVTPDGDNRFTLVVDAKE